MRLWPAEIHNIRRPPVKLPARLVAFDGRNEDIAYERWSAIYERCYAYFDQIRRGGQ